MTQNPGPQGVVAPAARSAFIAGPAYDLTWFILSPLWALVLGGLVSWWPQESRLVDVAGTPTSLVAICLRTVIHAHLVLVLVRSHGNRRVFNAFPSRFTVVPLLLAAAMMQWDRFYVAMIVLAAFWDIYHSSLQTFGLGRIYDARHGNDPQTGRLLDILFSHCIYVVPHVVGPLAVSIIGMLAMFRSVGDEMPVKAVPAALGFIGTWRGVMVAAAAAYAVFYVAAYARLVRRGYRVAPQKIALLACTAVSSVTAAGFGAFGEALLVLNVFHAVQYYAIVWSVEGANVRRLLRLEGGPGRRTLALAVLLGAALLYGFWFNGDWLWADTLLGRRAIVVVSNLVALMHFWYDGFIWSVRRGEATR